MLIERWGALSPIGKVKWASGTIAGVAVTLVALTQIADALDRFEPWLLAHRGYVIQQVGGSSSEVRELRVEIYSDRLQRVRSEERRLLKRRMDAEKELNAVGSVNERRLLQEAIERLDKDIDEVKEDRDKLGNTILELKKR